MRIGQRIQWFWYVIIVASSLSLCGLSYDFLADRQHANNPDDQTMPYPEQMWEGVKLTMEIDDFSGKRWLVVDSKATAARLFTGLAIGIVWAVVVGIAMGCFMIVDAFFRFILSFVALIPTICLLPFFFALKIPDFPMFVTIVIIVFMPVLALSIFHAVKSIPTKQVNLGYMRGGSNIELIRDIVFPQVLPRIIDVARLQFIITIGGLMVTEWVLGDVGFGFRMRDNYRTVNMDIIYPYVIILGIFSIVVDRALETLQEVLCWWYIEKMTPEKKPKLSTRAIWYLAEKIKSIRSKEPVQTV